MFPLKEKLDLKTKARNLLSDLFRFKTATLNPVVTELVDKFKTASKIEAPADKVEQLLAVREEADERLYGIAGKQTDKGMNGMYAALAGMFAVMIPGVVVASTIAVPAVFFLGIAVAGAGIGYIGKVFLNSIAADNDREAIESRVNTDVKKLAAAAPQEAAQSPRFLKSLTAAFGSSLIGNDTYKEMTWRVEPKNDYRESYHDFDHAPPAPKAPEIENAQKAVEKPAPVTEAAPVAAPAAAPKTGA